MNIDGLVDLSNSFYRAASEVLLYTFVPREAISSISKKGLLSADLLIKDKSALHLARPNDEKRFTKKVNEDLNNPETKLLTEGVSAFFTLPDWSKITKKHNISKLKLVPISINLSQLMSDIPDTKLIGVELSIYDEDMSDEDYDKRQAELTLNEVRAYTLTSPTDLWEGYDVSNTSHYASDVPHLIICPPAKKIDSKYLKL